MTKGLLYWILMLLWLLFGLWVHFWPPPAPSWQPLGSVLLLFILFTLLGWKVFGPPVQG